MSTTDTIRASFEAAYLSANGFHTKAELANEWKEGMLSSHMFRAGYQAATEAAKDTGTAGELFGYGSSEKKNCLLSKAQYDNCAPKNRTAYDIPLYAYSLPKCENCKGYGVITHISGQTPDNYEECNEVCPDCEGEGAARQPAPVAIKTWQERLRESASEGWTTLSETHMQAEIADLRAALAATAAPVVLSYLQLLAIADDSEAHEALQGFSEDPTQDNGVCVVRAILAATNRSQP